MSPPKCLILLLLIVTTQSYHNDDHHDDHHDNHNNNHNHGHNIDKHDRHHPTHDDEDPAESPPEYHDNHDHHHGNHNNYVADIPKPVPKSPTIHTKVPVNVKKDKKDKVMKKQPYHKKEMKKRKNKRIIISSSRHWIPPIDSKQSPDKHALPPANQKKVTKKPLNKHHHDAIKRHHDNDDAIKHRHDAIKHRHDAIKHRRDAIKHRRDAIKHRHDAIKRHHDDAIKPHHDNKQHYHHVTRIRLPPPSVIGTSLLNKIYHAIASVVSGDNDKCVDRKLTVFVGASSPVFGGILLSSPLTYINHFSIEGAGNSISRADVFGCSTLPGSDKKNNIPCGSGETTLLWTWYNGQSTITLPTNSSVQVGHKTDIQYIVTRITKFRSRKTKIKLHKQIVNLNFKQCETKPEFFASSYKFEISKLIQIRKYFYPKSRINLDISCKHRGPPFYIYGFTAHTGIYGKQIMAWKENGTWSQIGSTTVQNKMHMLDTYVLVNTGDHLHVRCNYKRPRQLGLLPSLTPYGNIKQEVCQMHLMILIDSKFHPFAPVCETASKFSPHDPDVIPIEKDEQGSTFGDSKYIQVLAVFSVFMVIYFLCKVYGCREMIGGKCKDAEKVEEAQGLISEPVDNSVKIR